MRRLITFLILFFTISGTILAQRMSDDQVIEYVKQAHQQGKSQTEIQTELLRRGITQQQVERLKARYQAEVAKQNDSSAAQTTQQRLRESEELFTTLPGEALKTTQTVPDAPAETAKNTKAIFGKNVFTNKQLSFEPNSNIATPVNYRLGPGDEVIIDIWGDNEASIRQVISPEGSIQVEGIGPVYLNGKTVKEANAYLQREFVKIYSGLSEKSSEIRLTLGQNRSIRVNIMGEVLVPGTYTLSSFSTVFHALYSAGGINSIGGLRAIEVIRGGKKIAEVDVYKYIISGQTNDDIRLMEDDVILVHPYEMLVNVEGKVKRPMFYEMKKGETLATLLEFAGGFTGNAYKQNVRLVRSNDREKQIFNIDEIDFSVFQLEDADAISIGSIIDRYENRAEIVGAVYRDGMYQINGSVNTVKQLIQKAEGLRGDAFLDRVLLKREREDLSYELLQIDLKGILKGAAPDIALQRNDILYIPSIHDLREERFVTIHGEVSNPGTYLYAENVTVEDLIIQAGGLLEAASTAKIDVSRRIKDEKSLEPVSIIGETFSLEIRDGLVIGDQKGFYLQAFDEVYVRKSPGYHKQQNVVVEGEVVFRGRYALSKKNERISDLINKAGGLTSEAYAKGARLLRKSTAEETRRKRDALKLAEQASDSVALKSLDLSDTYPVGIDLALALRNPGSSYDLVLREGDRLIIPEYINTVKINGAVMYPNTVLYKPGEGFKYYLNQAGGYGNQAKKRKAYVVYLNGTVARLKGSTSKLIEPGCEIIVPTKEEKRRMSTGEIISMGTSVTSLAAMVATLVNVFKK